MVAGCAGSRDGRVRGVARQAAVEQRVQLIFLGGGAGGGCGGARLGGLCGGSGSSIVLLGLVRVRIRGEEVVDRVALVAQQPLLTLALLEQSGLEVGLDERAAVVVAKGQRVGCVKFQLIVLSWSGGSSGRGAHRRG